MSFRRAGLLGILWASTAWAVSYEENAPGVNGFTSVDRITWRDSKGLNRDLYFARTYPNPVVPFIMGYATRITWQPDSSSQRIIAEEDPAGINAANAQGWGINVMHMDWRQFGGYHPIFGTGAAATTNKRDGFDFVQTPAFLGPHHLIYRITFKQYTQLIKDNNPRPFVYVTIDWFIADGLDYVVYAITQDASRNFRSDPIAYMNNSLAPYCLVSNAPWKGTTDWAGGSGPPEGQSWGDFKTFVTNNMRNWTYGDSNTVPYVWEWVTPSSGRGDAESGFVQTETYSQKRAGESFAHGQDAAGSHLPVYPDLGGEEMAYQLNFFDDYGTKRLTWGSRFGEIYGGGGSTPGYRNYSVAWHLGKWSDHGMRALIDETEGLHEGSIRVRATTGSLIGVGPEGSGNAVAHTYSPTGYNQVYRTWEVLALNNTAVLTFDSGNIGYRRPVIVVHDYTSNNVDSVAVRVNGQQLPASGFMASLDEQSDKLYVTLLQTLRGNSTIQISNGSAPQMSVVASVVISPSSTSVGAGHSANFSAQARDAAGNVLQHENLTWSVTGNAGSISNGSFTAGCTTGTFNGAIVARAANGVSGTASVTVVPGDVARLEITPHDVDVRSSETQQYSARVFDNCDNVLTGNNVTWSATTTAGTITQSGLFAASCTRGTYATGITARIGAEYSSTSVRVIGGRPHQISVSPAEVSLQSGALQQFTANVRDDCGNSVDDAVTWHASSTAVTITTIGWFTAGNDVGAHPNSVTADIGSIMDSASVIVLAPPMTGGGGGSMGGGGGGGEPTGGGGGEVVSVRVKGQMLGGIVVATLGGGAGGGDGSTPDAGIPTRIVTHAASEEDLPAASSCQCGSADGALMILGLLALFRRRLRITNGVRAAEP